MKSHGLPLPPCARQSASTRRDRLPSSRRSATAAFCGTAPSAWRGASSGRGTPEPQVRAEDPAQLQAADEDLARVVAAVLEGPQDGVGRVVVERLELVPVARQKSGAQVGLVEDAPGEVERVGAVAVDDVAGDRAGDLVPLGVVLDGRPAPAVAREVAGGVGEVDHQAAAVPAMGQVPLLVEPAPVIARRAVRAELAEVAPARRRTAPARRGLPARGAARRRRSSSRRAESRTAATVTVPAAPSTAMTLVRASWTPSAIEHLVARVIVLGDGSAAGNAVLLVAEDVLDAEHDARPRAARSRRSGASRARGRCWAAIAARNADGGRNSVPVGQKSRW